MWVVKSCAACDHLERGPLRLVLLQRLGEDRLPRGHLQVAGPVRHPQRRPPGRQVDAARLAERVRPSRSCAVGVGVPLGLARLRRVRRPGHHVDGVLVPAPGRAGVDQAAVRAASTTRCARSTVRALGDVDVARVGQLGVRLSR